MTTSQKSAAKLFSRVESGKIKKTNNFTVDKFCIGCGKCAEVCPAESIKLDRCEPVWTKDECYVCFGCLRVCPTESIRYGQQSMN